ncbi:MAG: hypothetical protein V2I57_05405 [Xanthomonadales bacterium]|jgi:hypothetical protein|nr:hypothetical protein [Xanthomonadales bacterium]
MMKQRPLFLALGGALALCSGAAAADVTLTQAVRIDAGGTLAMLGSSGTSTTFISGEKARVDNRMEASSGMMAAFAGNMDSSMILRLDREVLWQLDPDSQQYSEMTFDELRAQADEAMAQMEQMEGGMPIDEGECRWSEPKLSVDETGEKERFGGVRAEQTLITASQTCELPEGKACEVRWALDYWMAKKAPGGEETVAYSDAMARALGGDDAAALVQMQARGLMAMFKQGWDDVLEKTENMKGHPVKTVMTLSLGGPACTTQGGEQIALDDVWSRALDAGVDSAAYSAAGHAGSAAAREAADALGNGVGGSIAGSAVGSATRELASGMFSKFRKNREEKREQERAETQAAEAEEGFVNLFTISTELTDVDKGRVDASRFEVPAGWTRVSGGG